MRVDKASAKCHGCGKKGHFKAECRQTNPGNDQQGGSSRNRGKSSRQEANKATTAKGPDWGLSVTHEPDRESESEDDETVAFVASEDGWILDSGSSSHTIRDKSKLDNYEPYVTQVKVARQIVNTVGRGSLRVGSTVKGVTHNITFNDVIYIPNFANLISVGRLTDRGAHIVFNKHGCSISMEGQTILQATSYRRNLWRLRFDDEQATSVETAHVTSPVDKVGILHRRLGHPSIKSMERLVKDGILPDIDRNEFDDFRNRMCVPCVQGKQHRTSFLWSYPIERKSDAYEVYARWQARVERETGKRVRTLRTDNGGEYTSNTFKTYLRTLGIRAETTIPHTPQQNGKAERGNRTIEEKITCLLQDANGIDESERGRYWAEALNTATYLINRLPTSTNDGKTPYEAYHGSKPPLHHLRTFGSKAYVYDRTHDKHQSKTIDCILLGYGDDQFGKKAYRLKAKSDGRIIFSRDVKFDETPTNRLRQVTIEVPPRPAETNTGSGGERERRDDNERGQCPEREQPRARSTSEERHIAAQRQDDILDGIDSLPRAEPSPAAAPAAPTESTRPRREAQKPRDWWKLDEKKGTDG
jgi:hypothetical protein